MAIILEWAGEQCSLFHVLICKKIAFLTNNRSVSTYTDPSGESDLRKLFSKSTPRKIRIALQHWAMWLAASGTDLLNHIIISCSSLFKWASLLLCNGPHVLFIPCPPAWPSE